MSSGDFEGCAQLQRHRYDRSSTAALSDVADHDSFSESSVNFLWIEADTFPGRLPRDVASSSSVGVIRRSMSNHRASLRGLRRTSRFGACWSSS